MVTIGPVATRIGDTAGRNCHQQRQRPTIPVPRLSSIYLKLAKAGAKKNVSERVFGAAVRAPYGWCCVVRTGYRLILEIR